MRIITACHDRFELTAPFRISRGVKTAADVVTVTITESGVTGRGEGVPYPRYDETVESTLAEVAEAEAMLAAGADRRTLQTLMKPGAARNAVDCALWDLEARLTGTPVATRIGAPEPAPLASAITIGIDLPDAMRAAAAARADVPLLKVKVDAHDPERQLREVRAAAPGPRLIVDPNESWDRELLEAMQPVLVELRADLLEQPVPAADDGWLEGFRSAVPICADEAVHTADDLDRVARRYQVVNVKLDKSGGLTGGLELARAARARRLGLMTGCMVSSSLSIAASLHIARMSDFVDLDGPLWLREDRAGGVRDDAGVMTPPVPGFWGTPAD